MSCSRASRINRNTDPLLTQQSISRDTPSAHNAQQRPHRVRNETTRGATNSSGRSSSFDWKNTFRSHRRMRARRTKARQRNSTRRATKAHSRLLYQVSSLSEECTGEGISKAGRPAANQKSRTPPPVASPPRSRYGSR